MAGTADAAAAAAARPAGARAAEELRSAVWRGLGGVDESGVSTMKGGSLDDSNFRSRFGVMVAFATVTVAWLDWFEALQQ